MNRDLLGSATCPWRRNSKRAVHSEAVPSQQRPLPSRLATWTPPLVTPEPHARSTPLHSGYYPLKQQLQHIPTRQPSPSFQNAQTATCTTPLLPMSTDSPLSHEQKLVYALYRKHSSRPHCPQAPALENGRTKTCTTHKQCQYIRRPPNSPASATCYRNKTKCTARSNSIFQSTPQAHDHRILGTGTEPTARHAPTASCRAPPQPTSTGHLVQKQHHLHDKPQKSMQSTPTAHQRRPLDTGTAQTAQHVPIASCRAPPQPTSTGQLVQEQLQLHGTLQQHHV